MPTPENFTPLRIEKDGKIIEVGELDWIHFSWALAWILYYHPNPEFVNPNTLMGIALDRAGLGGL